MHDQVDAIVSSRQAAWLKHRLGVKHVVDLQYALRHAVADGLDPVAALLDLEDAFPRVRRAAIPSMLRAFGLSNQLVHLA